MDVQSKMEINSSFERTVLFNGPFSFNEITPVTEADQMKEIRAPNYIKCTHSTVLIFRQQLCLSTKREIQKYNHENLTEMNNSTKVSFSSEVLLPNAYSVSPNVHTFTN